MSHLIATHAFNQAQLDKLIENRLSFYSVDTAEDAKRSGRSAHGALEYVVADSPLQLLQTFQEKLGQGYTLNTRLPVTALQTVGYGTFSCYMQKPVDVQSREIEAIKVEIAQQYDKQRLQVYEQHKAQIVADSLARAKRAEAKKVAEAEAKLVAKLEKEAAEALGGFS